MANVFFNKNTVRSTVNVLKNTALGLGIVLGLTLPLAERNARAQQLAQASVSVAQTGTYRIETRGKNGLATKEMKIKNSQESLKVHFVYPPEQEFSVLKMQGPANFVVYFYPFLNKEKIKRRERVDIKVTYELGGVEQTINGTTGISNFDLEIKGVAVHKALAIGVPIMIKGIVSEGNAELLITGPKGVFRVGYVERIDIKQEPKITRTDEPSTTTTTEAKSIDDKNLMPLPVFIASYENLSLAREHEIENQNDINRVAMNFSPLHSRRLALLLGVFGNYDNASVSTNDSFEGTVKFYSFGANVGLAFAFPRQLLLVNASGGARKMSANLDYRNGAIAVEDNALQPELGLRLGYEFAEKLRLNGEVSNNPLLPGQFKLALELPFSLSRGDTSEIETNLLYFKLLMPAISSDANGTTAFFTNNREDVISRTTLNLPFLDLNRVLFSVVGGYEAEAMAGAELEHVGMAGLSARIRMANSKLSLGGLYLTDDNFAVSALLDLLANPYSFQANFIQFNPSGNNNLRETSVHGEKHERN